MQISKAKSHELQQLVLNDKACNETPWTMEDYQNSLNNSKHTIYITKLGNEIIGCIVISQIFDESEILQFWIKGSQQGHGYGAQLINNTLHSVRLSGATIVFLEVASHNNKAIALYKKIGFKQVGLRKNYYLINNSRYDALIMQIVF